MRKNNILDQTCPKVITPIRFSKATQEVHLKSNVFQNKKELFRKRLREFRQRENIRRCQFFIQKNGIAAIFVVLMVIVAVANVFYKHQRLQFQDSQTKVQILIEQYEESRLAEEQNWNATETENVPKTSVMLASIGSIANPLMSAEDQVQENPSENLVVTNQALVAGSPVLTTVSQQIEGVRQETETENPGEQVTEEKAKPRKLIEKYTVQKGDTMSTIAAANGITTATLLQSNGLNETSNIQPGDSLNIPAASGIIVTVKKGDTLSSLVKTYKANDEKTVIINNISGDTIQIGQKVLLVNGSAPPAPKPTPTPSKSTVASSSKSTGTSAVQTAKAKEVSETTDPYHKPVAYGYSYGRVHSNNGVDISRNNGASVYSYKAGTVIQAAEGWNGGYGNCIKVQHADGTVSLYGHLSTIYVANGQSVEKGQVIGTIGSTGRSTGPHLHFEVRGGTNPYAGYVGNI